MSATLATPSPRSPRRHSLPASSPRPVLPPRLVSYAQAPLQVEDPALLPDDLEPGSVPPPVPKLPSPTAVQSVLRAIEGQRAHSHNEQQHMQNTATAALMPDTFLHRSSTSALAPSLQLPPIFNFSFVPTRRRSLSFNQRAEGGGAGEHHPFTGDTSSSTLYFPSSSHSFVSRLPTAEHTLRPTTLLSTHPHQALLPQLLKMGFSSNIAERALENVEMTSVEAAVEAALLIQEQEADARMAALRQAELEREKARQQLIEEERRKVKDQLFTSGGDANQELSELDSVTPAVTVTVSSSDADEPSYIYAMDGDKSKPESAIPPTLPSPPRPPPPLVPVDPARFTCPACTYSNPIAAVRCEVCDTRKPSELGTGNTPVKPLQYNEQEHKDLPQSCSVHRDSLSALNPETTCMICFEPFDPDAGLAAPCHDYCKDCWTGYLTSKVNDGQVLLITCPDPNCTRPIPPNEIKARLPVTMHAKFDRFFANAQIALDPNSRWCPTRDCETVMIGSRFQPKLKCPKCKVRMYDTTGRKQSLCFNCNEAWHGRLSCEQAANVIMSSYKRSHDVKPCPKCKIPIERSEGCNHMTCSRCKFQFCWLCSRSYSKHHFAMWNLFGCPGLQDGALSCIGNDQVFCCNCSLGCGFAGHIKRSLFRVWVLFALLITFIALSCPAVVLGLLCSPCLYWKYKRYKKQKAEETARREAERAERRARRHARRLARQQLALRRLEEQQQQQQQLQEQQQENNNQQQHEQPFQSTPVLSQHSLSPYANHHLTALHTPQQQYDHLVIEIH